MTSTPAHTDANSDATRELAKDTSVEDNERDRVKPSTANGSRVELPEPDLDNITVLTGKLPNKPILPWNHYDSPWQEEEEEPEKSETEGESTADEVLEEEVIRASESEGMEKEVESDEVE